MESTIKIREELLKLLENHSFDHLLVGSQLFIPAREDVPGYAANACLEEYPVRPIERRSDLPAEIKNGQIDFIHFYGLGDPLYGEEAVKFFNDPDASYGILALQNLDLKGKAVLDADCRLGEHSIAAAHLGAKVLAVDENISYGMKQNREINGMEKQIYMQEGDVKEVLDNISTYEKIMKTPITVAITDNSFKNIEALVKSDHFETIIASDVDGESIQSMGYNPLASFGEDPFKTMIIMRN